MGILGISDFSEVEGRVDVWAAMTNIQERWSPFSWSPKPITRAGEFSPRRAGRGLVEGSPRSHSPAGPKSPTVYGIEGRSHRKGLCSPRDVRCSVFEADSTDARQCGEML